MRLPDVDSKVFGLLVTWVYQQEIEGGKSQRLLQLVKLWMLAERCLIPDLQNQVMDLIQAGFQDEVLEVVHFVYETSAANVLKKSLVNKVARLAPARLGEWIDLLPQEMITEVALALNEHCSKLPENKKLHRGKNEGYYV